MAGIRKQIPQFNVSSGIEVRVEMNQLGYWIWEGRAAFSEEVILNSIWKDV